MKQCLLSSICIRLWTKAWTVLMCLLSLIWKYLHLLDRYRGSFIRFVWSSFKHVAGLNADLLSLIQSSFWNSTFIVIHMSWSRIGYLTVYSVTEYSGWLNQMQHFLWHFRVQFFFQNLLQMSFVFYPMQLIELMQRLDWIKFPGYWRAMCNKNSIQFWSFYFELMNGEAMDWRIYSNIFCFLMVINILIVSCL